MNIYEFKEDETDWIFAPTKKEAIDFYLNHTGMAKSDLDEYKIRRLIKAELKEYSITDIDAYYDQEDIPEEDEHLYSGGYKIVSSFQEYVDTHTVTDIVATTAY